MLYRCMGKLNARPRLCTAATRQKKKILEMKKHGEIRQKSNGVLKKQMMIRKDAGEGFYKKTIIKHGNGDRTHNFNFGWRI